MDSQDIIKIAIPTTQTLQLQALLEQYGFYYILPLVCLLLLVMVEYWGYGNV